MTTPPLMICGLYALCCGHWPECTVGPDDLPCRVSQEEACRKQKRMLTRANDNLAVFNVGEMCHFTLATDTEVMVPSLLEQPAW